MKMADILRKLADVIDSADDTGNAGSDYDNNGQLDPHERDHAEEKPLLKSLDTDADGDHDMDDHAAQGDDTEGDTYIPPLQAKLELMKKSEGVPNAYDDDDAQLNSIKKNAGIMKHELADDEPVDV